MLGIKKKITVDDHKVKQMTLGKTLKKKHNKEIKAIESAKTGNLLISSFRSEASGAKKALRYHNPSLDAWLYYWGKTSTFASPTGEEVYQQLAKQTGRKI